MFKKKSFHKFLTKKISTLLLTVLTTSVILLLEQKETKKVFTDCSKGGRFMNISKFTQKFLEAVQYWKSWRGEYGNQQIDQEHLLYSLLTVEDSLIFKLITKMGISGDQFRDEVQQAIGKAAEGIRRSGVFLQRCQQGAGRTRRTKPRRWATSMFPSSTYFWRC